MTTRTLFKLSAMVSGVLAAAATATLLASAAAPKFFDDDPIWVERDSEDASGMKPLEVGLIVDLGYNLLNGKPGPAVRAMNVNTVDEVPDSSWFTNRIGQRTLTPEEIAVGPDTSNGPAPGQWTVTSSKSDGVTPGFTIKDGSGSTWFLKFDPPGYRGMTTGTEVLVTKLMWALGYHVAENHIAYLHKDQLVVGSGARFTPAGGKRRSMKLDDLDTLLKRADREPDGSYRVVASKALPGKPIGRIRFFDTRPDDPNDIVPHEHRRELRAYGVFAAWLNHVDAKAINSLDVLVTENNRSYVRHNLLDFGSTLGSGGVGPADPFAGNEYLVEPAQTLKQMAGFGFVFPSWHTERFYESRSIGRLPEDNTGFNPESWKPRVPNRAFLQARADDKFWAAQRLAAFNSEMIRAAVQAAQLNDPRSEEFLVRALLERRDAILRAYLPALNPISRPTLDADGVLTFRNAAVEADVAHIPDGYHAKWSRFDNATGETRVIGESTSGTTTVKAPGSLPRTEGAFIKVQLRSIGGASAAWEKPVNAYFRLRGSRWNLVGFERLPEA
jgi:hypothetical protein